MSRAEEVGKAGLAGWRGRLGNRLAEPTAQRTPLNADQVKAIVGAIFMVLSAVYLVSSLRRVRRQAAGT